MPYLDKAGLKTFLAQSKEIFGLKSSTDTVRDAIDVYILNFDYTALEFDTDWIISGEATSATLGVGKIGMMLLGNP